MGVPGIDFRYQG